MTKFTFRSGTCAEVASLRDVFVVAIDLGFAKEKRSCGLAWRVPDQDIKSAKLRFGECVESVRDLFKDQSKAVLIIEAPLSGVFSADGNPLERGDFEKRPPGGKTDRYWYSGPGAATCLAAVFFLRELCSNLCEDVADQTSFSELVLYEGFVTFKSAVTDHERDARLLLDSFLGIHKCDLVSLNTGGGQAVVTVVDVVRDSTSSTAPPALIVPKKEGE